MERLSGLCEAASRVGVDLTKRYGHCNPKQAGEVAREAGARSLWLTHYSGHDGVEVMCDDARASGYEGALRVACDGDEVVW